jgi:hypothetical protein
MIKVRELPAKEYHRLAGLPIAAGNPDPTRCQILVAENEAGEIVGTFGVLLVPLLEGLWVREDYRKTTTFGRLWNGMQQFLKRCGFEHVAGFVETADMKNLAEKAGFTTLEGTLCHKRLH